MKVNTANTPSGLRITPLRRPDETVDCYAAQDWLNGTERKWGGVITSAWLTADELLVLRRNDDGWSATAHEDGPAWQALDEAEQERVADRIEWSSYCRTRAELIERLAVNGTSAGMPASPWREIGKFSSDGRMMLGSACHRWALFPRGEHGYDLYINEGALVMAEPGLERVSLTTAVLGLVKEPWRRFLEDVGALGPYGSLAEATELLDAACLALPSIGCSITQAEAREAFETLRAAHMTLA